MGEDAVPALRQRAPRLRLHAESLHVLNSPALREEGVQFHLIDHGRDARVETKVGETIRIEVAHANGAGAASLVELLHRPPGGVVIVHRLVDEVEVYVVKAQFVAGGALHIGVCLHKVDLFLQFADLAHQLVALLSQRRHLRAGGVQAAVRHQQADGKHQRRRQGEQQPKTRPRVDLSAHHATPSSSEHIVNDSTGESAFL